ncbi:pyruvate:ferredoxin (flavodoxin) oxidoreductase [Paramagnetospirillum magneticum]|uniref:Pyruvate-flavodoxin oxidoreductase n=1 Tax=Paramagnetospirillum magneticum (strain ATCC 700264 / AMB-1) TaxID=342108 RepID=Q2W5T1_PARM1|nr:pyruvate:ferredoxin (flavodoxin) oxidoreductase [Paramagnetospirillum magneticum]BAE50794.1 Pyruvate-flavodoxin oxidoreductase [Paramagnetospirillum magneticum AMB-1]
MADRALITVDGNEACASVAYRVSEVAAIYPITPSSTMGELADQWASEGRKNIWGVIPDVAEMQHEGGAAGAVHGALQAGSLATTFTASQGLLLMIPNMYKIAGELTSFCMHVTARTVATHGLSIFGDHSDVMACRQTGFAMLASGSGQEAHDMAAIAHAATLKARVPFLHFFDGFRTSHEVTKIEELNDEDLLALLDADCIAAHRARALSPDHPTLRGTAQNPDTFFQMQEARNPWYDRCAGIVQEEMDQYAKLTGRAYKLFDYCGHPQAERVVIIMGSGAETVHETVTALVAKGEKVGVLKVRLYRPFSIDAFVSALPTSVRSIAVLDRCKEPGSIGEPLYLDVLAGLAEAKAAGNRATAADPRVIGGRYGLASKEFTPAMAKAVFDELAKDKPKAHFTVGITDDVTHLSLVPDESFKLDQPKVKRAVFFGLGADGTVGANKNSIKIIAENAGFEGQGYFVYDSKKSGAITISHLRFSPEPIQSAYLLDEADFVACHHFVFLDKYEVLRYAAPGATFLLNSPYPKDEVWNHLPREVQQEIIDKKLQVHVIDARKVALATGMGNRINTIMQTCFFALSGVLPKDEAIGHIKKAIEKTYGRKSEKLVAKNFEAVDETLHHLEEVAIPDTATSNRSLPPIVPEDSPDFVKRVSALMLSNHGDRLPVSAFPVDGVWPTGTARFERRNIAAEIPVWDEGPCIQCNKCALVCPHAAIRAKVAEPADMADAPASLKRMDWRSPEFKGSAYIIQVAPEDCTGCTLCVKVCPGKDKKDPSRLALRMESKDPILETEKKNWAFFVDLPEVNKEKLGTPTVKTAQLLQPLFEFSGACLGCGETPYIKLMTQLWGDRLMIANATGCSSIYGGNLPTTPYAQNAEGRGPAWANSLFEDNAEFGFGFRLAVDQHKNHAKLLLAALTATGQVPEKLANEIAHAPQATEVEIAAQRLRILDLRKVLAGLKTAEARQLEQVADYLAEKVVWIVGGDGWAYDIGYGGLDHVFASGKNVNILVMDTEVYSNTGGQQSKATPIGASAKFAIAGKTLPKKDLGMMAMAYEDVYVANVAFGSKDVQTMRAFQDAVSYPGVSLIVAYSHCIAHGYDLAHGLDQQKMAVEAGYWPLYRWDPRKMGTGESPLTLDSKEPNGKLYDFMKGEARFQMVERADPERYRRLVESAETQLRRRFAMLRRFAGQPDVTPPSGGKEAAE